MKKKIHSASLNFESTRRYAQWQQSRYRLLAFTSKNGSNRCDWCRWVRVKLTVGNVFYEFAFETKPSFLGLQAKPKSNRKECCGADGERQKVKVASETPYVDELGIVELILRRLRTKRWLCNRKKTEPVACVTYHTPTTAIASAYIGTSDRRLITDRRETLLLSQAFVYITWGERWMHSMG